MSPLEQELREKATKYAIAHGTRVDMGDHDWELRLDIGRLSLGVTDIHNAPNQKRDLRVSLKEKDSWIRWAVIHDDEMPTLRCYNPDLFQEALDELKKHMVLDELADV